MIGKRTAKELAVVEQFRTEGGPAVREYCPHLTKLDCCRRAAAPACAFCMSDQEAEAVLPFKALKEQCMACYFQFGAACADTLFTAPLCATILLIWSSLEV